MERKFSGHHTRLHLRAGLARRPDRCAVFGNNPVRFGPDFMNLPNVEHVKLQAERMIEAREHSVGREFRDDEKALYRLAFLDGYAQATEVSLMAMTNVLEASK